MPALLDLQGVDESRRAAAWQGGARDYFPGLSVSELDLPPASGTIAGSRFGSGRLWTIVSPPLHVSYDPSGAPADRPCLFSVMMQLDGATLARQSGRAALLEPGEICVIDSRIPFELSVAGALSQFAVLELPRNAVLSRHPYLQRRTAEAFDPMEPGTVLLRNVLLDTLQVAARLQDDQRGVVLGAVIQLLGAPHMKSYGELQAPGWRVQAALSYIDARLADPELTATQIADAQGVSRRRLDEIMVAAIGVSLSARIRLRRLEQAASDLTDERFAGRTITQIAFSAGFENIAHFTRTFKRRYRVPPREWRQRQRSASQLQSAGFSSTRQDPGSSRQRGHRRARPRA